ncbi:hypothetical protein E4U17_005827 [Claviceps sp. LM77 group G4]|nr:hypothetical protein E4U17_005827 [Claviceps sp. LM77 group G4]KAG6064648.1 hypothetical protein E4U33_006069 [Claviceps sp. LM78 group G4]
MLPVEPLASREESSGLVQELEDGLKGITAMIMIAFWGPRAMILLTMPLTAGRVSDQENWADRAESRK